MAVLIWQGTAKESDQTHHPSTSSNELFSAPCLVNRRSPGICCYLQDNPDALFLKSCIWILEMTGPRAWAVKHRAYPGNSRGNQQLSRSLLGLQRTRPRVLLFRPRGRPTLQNLHWHQYQAPIARGSLSVHKLILLKVNTQKPPAFLLPNCTDFVHFQCLQTSIWTKLSGIFMNIPRLLTSSGIYPATSTNSCQMSPLFLARSELLHCESWNTLSLCLTACWKRSVVQNVPQPEPCLEKHLM